MQCPECGGRGRVSSTFNHGQIILRYRKCPICDHRWKAWEEIDPAKVRAKKPKAQVDMFSDEKQKKPT